MKRFVVFAAVMAVMLGVCAELSSAVPNPPAGPPVIPSGIKLVADASAVDFQIGDALCVAFPSGGPYRIGETKQTWLRCYVFTGNGPGDPKHADIPKGFLPIPFEWLGEVVWWVNTSVDTLAGFPDGILGLVHPVQHQDPYLTAVACGTNRIIPFYLEPSRPKCNIKGTVKTCNSIRRKELPNWLGNPNALVKGRIYIRVSEIEVGQKADGTPCPAPPSPTPVVCPTPNPAPVCQSPEPQRTVVCEVCETCRECPLPQATVVCPGPTPVCGPGPKAHMWGPNSSMVPPYTLPATLKGNGQYGAVATYDAGSDCGCTITAATLIVWKPGAGGPEELPFVGDELKNGKRFEITHQKGTNDVWRISIRLVTSCGTETAPPIEVRLTGVPPGA